MKRAKKGVDYDKTLETLLSSVDVLPSCDKAMGECLEKLRLRTLWDILRHTPRRYQDRSRIMPLSQLKVDEEVCAKGKVVSLRKIQQRNRRYRTEVTIEDDSKGRLTAVYFAQAGYFHKMFQKNDEVIFFGKVANYNGKAQISHPEFEIIENPMEFKMAGILAIYASTEGLEQKQMRRLVFEALKVCQDHLLPTLPKSLEEKREMLTLFEAIRCIHFPKTMAEIDEADKRLDYEEIFHMQLGLLAKRQFLTQKKKLQVTKASKEVHKRINDLIPFDLTGAQKRVIQEIINDFGKSAPMNRLVQGDVGSGKTVVAVYALLVKIAAGEQVAFMAPTEILAEQHFRSLQKLLPSAKFDIILLTGRTKKKDRSKILEGLADGSYPLVIGTHALVTGTVKFKNLGLAIIDEQHKFGVLQRADLQSKGQNPDVLVMTATPIPRTLSLTLYGDLHVSIIDEMPPGRQEIVTKQVASNHRKTMNNHIKKEIKKGRQVYMVFPLVEESEKLDLQAASTAYEKLKVGEFKEFRLGLIHGKLKGDLKEKVMKDFREGKIDILISTVVIEVGVDVPNATVMLIEHAERFGLATLHQLRGRIGRGEHKSYCFLISFSKGKDSQLRLSTLCNHLDGFKVAEVDLELRGAGDYFGTRQSGTPGSRIGRILHNLPLISFARQDALELLDDDPQLESDDVKGCHFGYRLQFSYSMNLSSIA
jgi:ATP-dependent DNA helicase RecG